MKMLFAGALVLSCAMLPGQVLAGPIEDRIRHIEDEISVAYAANDLPRYFSFYAESGRAMFDEGPITLAEYRKTWTAFVKGGGGIVSFSLADLVVQVSPARDVAVASYRAKARTRDASGKTTDDSFLETDVFFHRHGAWKIEEIHYSAFHPSEQ